MLQLADSIYNSMYRKPLPISTTKIILLMEGGKVIKIE